LHEEGLSFLKDKTETLNSTLVTVQQDVVSLQAKKLDQIVFEKETRILRDDLLTVKFATEDNFNML